MFRRRGMGKQKNILVVEDEYDINNMLCDLLKQNSYNPIPAFSGTESLMLFKQEQIDLVLLDLMLPGKSGEVVLAEIREDSQVPVIAITAIVSKETIVSTLKIGAKDYIAKPFDNGELLSRIQVQLRHSSFIPKSIPNIILTYKDLTLNKENYDVTLDGQSIHLSKREYEILKILMENPQKVFTKNNLYESVWKDEYIGDDNTINVHISNIRSKISKLRPSEKYIKTVWGIGYKLVE